MKIEESPVPAYNTGHSESRIRKVPWNYRKTMLSLVGHPLLGTRARYHLPTLDES